ncbi:MAG: GTPase HflX [Terriglobia bacterium]
MKRVRRIEQAEQALLVGVALAGGPPVEESLEELAELARGAGAQVWGQLSQARSRPDPACFIGRGKLEEIRAEVAVSGADLLIFDQNLTPTQQRNIEQAVGCRTIDRTQLILDIFAHRARSHEGQLQVELAQLNYLLPRLVGRGTALSRLGGGIGTRGPGETQLETDRRRIRRRLRKIAAELEAVRRRRAQQRAARQAGELATLALVGYTNSGKSTLFNALTQADVRVSQKMFATLDPTVRALRLASGRRVLLADTVGFIRDLPPGLTAAFRATLEEVQEAAMLIHVSDISNPRHTEQDGEVEKVVAALGLDAKPRLRVFNKIDRLPAAERARLRSRDASAFVSALQGWGLDALREELDRRLPGSRRVRLRLELSPAQGRTLALLHRHGHVLSQRYRDGRLSVEAELPEFLARQLTRNKSGRPVG